MAQDGDRIGHRSWALVTHLLRTNPFSPGSGPQVLGICPPPCTRAPILGTYFFSRSLFMLGTFCFNPKPHFGAFWTEVKETNQHLDSKSNLVELGFWGFGVLGLTARWVRRGGLGQLTGRALEGLPGLLGIPFFFWMEGHGPHQVSTNKRASYRQFGDIFHLEQRHNVLMERATAEG